MKLSIIIPCYNASKYLGDLLNGILEQINDQVEVIIVEDCSTDNTKEIIDCYSLRCENFVVINNASNKGISSSRNKALDLSRGEYIWFVDSDDQIEKDAIPNILNEISLPDAADIICYSHIINETIRGKVIQIDPPIGEYKKTTFITNVLKKKFTFHLWNKVISREFIGNARSDKNITVLVDMNFFLNVIRGKDFTLKTVNKVIYKYYLRPGSTITQINKKKLKDQQYTFNLFMSDCENLNAPNLKKYILKENISTSYQVVRNKGDLLIGKLNFIQVIYPYLSLKERYKLLYILFSNLSKNYNDKS